jgi:hypothetical protein
MLTRQTLRRLATEKVFDRGQELYAAGAVKKLQQPGPTRFVARVKGTYSYNVAAWQAHGDMEFSCDCPYDFEGICKHAVALGLAILDTHQAGAAPAVVAAAGAAVPDLLRQAWEQHPAADKLRFLEQALAKNDDLARQFLAFVAAAPAEMPDEEDPHQGLTERLHETLAALDFGEEFWEQYERDMDGYDEGENLSAAALEEVSTELQPFAAELLALARAGQLTAALSYWATACLAIFQVEEPASDDYGAFGDYGTDVLLRWHADLQAAGWPQLLLAAVLPPAELHRVLAWLGHYLADPPGRWYQWDESWQPLLLALAADAEAAPLLSAALAAAPITAGTRARLRLQTARTQANDSSWVAAAEALLPTDATVAAQLLRHYRTQSDQPALLRTAEAAFAAWPDQFAGIVLDTFNSDQAPALYRTALRHRALANHSLTDAERLHPLLSAAGWAGVVQAAVSRARASRDGVGFAAELLFRGQDAGALREFVLGLEWLAVSRPGDVDLALARLAELNPLPLMLDLETRLPAYLMGRAGAKRGAFLYQRLASWLASVRRAAPRLTEPVLRLAQALREEFRTLHGLRDALWAQQLLPVPEVAADEAPQAKRGRKKKG